ncbi:MAG: hypothetical protein P1U87_18710 [Verrucomicrobiales bacterium]|nr:hypothetical protein [Verrucomicrobiales bacterium]
MIFPFSSRGIRTVLAFSCLLIAPVLAYDSPDFDTEVFRADGIFLEDSEKQSLLEALASIATNFPENRRIDSDLKEKALGIALRLDPLHHNSRNAHQLLSLGRVPASTQYFDSLSGVTEVLWTISVRLSSDPVEPEEKELAKLLMELSLLLHPDPPKERLRRFAELTGGEKNPWSQFIQLQPDDNPSSSRSAMLMREMQDILKEPKPAPPVPDPKVTKVDKPKPKPVEKPKPINRPEKFEMVRRSIPSVRLVTAVESVPVPGIFSLEIRPPGGDIELEIFPFVLREDVSAYPQLPILPSSRGITINEIVISPGVAAEKGWNWTKGSLGEVSFNVDDGPLPGPRRICRAQGVLPTMILLQSALKDLPINEALVVAGELNVVTLEPEIEGAVLPVIRAAQSLDARFLLLPESSLNALVKELQVSGELGLLFKLEILSYTTADEAVALATTAASAELLTALESFAEVEAVSDKMPLIDFARNSKVQDRLEGILVGAPNYLSARAMLEFGRAPVSEDSKIAQSVALIDEWVGPYLEMDGGFDFNELRNKLSDAEFGLARLRTEIHPDTRDYHTKAEDLIEAAENYLSLTNLTTSTADQRLREVEKAIGEAKTQRDLLVAAPESE